MRLASAALILVACFLACAQPVASLPPLGQLVVYLDTDAIVPRGTVAYGPLDPYPLFDHVRFDATGSSPDCDCTRDFEIDQATLAAGRISFGIVPPPSGGGTLRARLFRYADTEAGEPRAETTIDATFAIESVPVEGIVERTLTLETKDVGTQQGKDAPLAMSPGRPATFRAGSWPLGARVDCAAPPREGEVCIPGGAFWMGSPLEARRSDRSGAQRLAVLSPYYLDATEVTVAAFRKSGLGAVPWSGGKDGSKLADSCTFTTAVGPHEDYPVNCVTPQAAAQYCRALGGDLPTEAQYEYAASALRSAPFVWGTDPPTCDGVVMCRQGGFYISGDASCRELGTIGGAMPAGSGKLDRLVLPTGTVVDLIGNVSELVRDAWARLDEPCWARSGLYLDPVCTTPGTLDPSPAYSLRGGEWEVTPNRAAGRFFTDRQSPLHGFRCARAAR